MCRGGHGGAFAPVHIAGTVILLISKQTLTIPAEIVIKSGYKDGLWPRNEHIKCACRGIRLAKSTHGGIHHLYIHSVHSDTKGKCMHTMLVGPSHQRS